MLLFELLLRPGARRLFRRPRSCVEVNQCETCGRVTFDFHTGDVEVCCFQEDFACLAAPADAPRVCGVLGYTLYPAKGCCITLKQLYPERPEIVLKQNNTVLCAGCVGVGEKTLWSQAIYCRPPATFLFVELRCCCLAHDLGLNIAGDGDGCVLPNCSEYSCGNQISGAPRRQRDPNSTQASTCRWLVLS